VAKNVQKIARKLEAKIVGRVPDVGGGAFGAARLAAALRDRLQPSPGERPGRPSDPTWEKRPKVPMSPRTLAQLEKIAAQLSTPDRKVSPMQVAAHLLETSVAEIVGQRVSDKVIH
jgi:hypothetical protein